MQVFSVTGGNGKFIAKWNDPATGNQTIDDVAISWSINPSFSPEAPIHRQPGWGARNRLESESPNCIFWFRVAVHNQSNQPSHASTASAWALPAGVHGRLRCGCGHSGTATGAGWQAPGENLCPNGGFELDADNDGLPDDCTYPQDGAAVAGAVKTINAFQGNYAFIIPPGSSSIGLGGFAVTPGEILSASVRVIADAVSAQAGFYFRLAFHDSTRQFTGTGAAYVDIVRGVIVSAAAWTRYEGQVEVPVGMKWCRVILYNFATTDVGYLFDDVVVTRTATANDIGDNTIPPEKFTGGARIEFLENFENPLNLAIWEKGGLGTISYPNSGVDGGKVLRAQGSVLLHPHQEIYIPYDPRKRYRMTCRARLMLTADSAKTELYVGVNCYSNTKAYLNAIYVTAYGLPTYPTWLPAEVWHELTGWFKGTFSGGYVQPAPNPAIPSPLPTGTAYISPILQINFPQQAPLENILEIDDIRIDAVSESGEVVTDTLANAIITTQKLVDQAVIDVKLATASVTTTKIADDSVTTPKLVALNVTAAKIAALAITADKINVATLSAITVNAGEITAGIITGLLIRTGAGYPRIEMDSTKFRSIDASNTEYFKIEPQAIGTKVYGHEWRMHPNIGQDLTMVIAGHQNKRSSILISSAEGTEGANRSYAYIYHGEPGTLGFISLATINAERMRISEIGIGIAGRVEMSDMAHPSSSSGLTLYSRGGIMGIWTRSAAIADWNSSTYPLTKQFYVEINGSGYVIPLAFVG